MPVGQIFHPKLMQHLADRRFGSTCDVQHKNVAQNSYGEEIVTYVTDALLRQISCQVEPRTNRADSEVRRPDATVVTQPFDALLAGYYPSIGVEDQLLVWPQQTRHNILRVAHDDQRAYTTLTTEIVSG